MKQPVKIAIFENYSLFNSGLRSMLSDQDQFEITGISSKVADLMVQIRKNMPDVLLFDILHTDGAGSSMLKKIIRKFPELPVVIMTSMQFSDCFADLVKLGVRGFVFENETPDDLRKALRKVTSGTNYIPAEMQKWLKDVSPAKAVRPGASRRNILTEREISILKLFCQGLTYKEIGKQLFISPRTVETHKKNILTKLRLKSTAEMVKYAFHNRLII
ncbi:response regulator transcription factor [Mangrovibacterium marinum]|nr:response regulator transcription factor [Mangrovibacterium marinum]